MRNCGSDFPGQVWSPWHSVAFAVPGVRNFEGSAGDVYIMATTASMNEALGKFTRWPSKGVCRWKTIVIKEILRGFGLNSMPS